MLLEFDQQLFELIFCACSAREEEQWKMHILDHSTKEEQRQMDDQSASLPYYSVLSLGIKSLGNVFGLPGTLIRRISIQRAATVSPRSNACQVIIKNTTVLRDHNGSPNTVTSPVGRSQSCLSTARVSILAPKRADRLRMECALTDVWTREFLPFPGMSCKRGEHLIRTSASSMMRKLSRASITSNFTKRSPSLATLTDEGLGQTDFQSVNDGKVPRTPGLHPYQSIESFTVTTLDQQALTTPRRFEPPERTSSARGMMPIKGNGLTQSFQGSQASAKSASKEDSKMECTKNLRNKKSRPQLLLNKFSTEGIRSWFT